MSWYRQLPQKPFFGDILRAICHNDFKCGSINFHKPRKQPANYQTLGIASLRDILGHHHLYSEILIVFKTFWKFDQSFGVIFSLYHDHVFVVVSRVALPHIYYFCHKTLSSSLCHYYLPHCTPLLLPVSR